MKKAHVGLAVIVVSMFCSSLIVAGEKPPAGEAAAVGKSSDANSKGMAAMKKAADKKRYLFIFFYKQNDAPTEKMRKVFDEATQKLSEKADAVVVNITDSAEAAVVKKFEVSKAPMPLVLAVAPNGAITGGYPKEFDEARLNKAFVSPAMADCLKELQDQKLVFVCVQNGKTAHNEAAMEGVNAFKADAMFAEDTRLVKLDPSKPGEAKTLQNLQVDPKTTEAVTVFLAPPGAIVGKFQGATTKEQFLTALKSKMSSCAPGSGCCPSPSKK